MTAADLLRRCAAAGVVLAAEAGRLHAAGPAEGVHELAPLLRERRAELLALLSQGPEPNSAPYRAEGACAAPVPAEQGIPDPAKQAHSFERERQTWTPATEQELAAMAATFERAMAFGLTPQEADIAVDAAHWGRSTGDDRRLCIACAHLRAGANSRWWCSAQRMPMPMQLVAELPHRCELFADADTVTAPSPACRRGGWRATS
ncbi:MAG: hypothetical protein ACK4MJ_07765 [Hylemonella sp.]